MDIEIKNQLDELMKLQADIEAKIKKQMLVSMEEQITLLALQGRVCKACFVLIRKLSEQINYSKYYVETHLASGGQPGFSSGAAYVRDDGTPPLVLVYPDGRERDWPQKAVYEMYIPEFLRDGTWTVISEQQAKAKLRGAT